MATRGREYSHLCWRGLAYCAGHYQLYRDKSSTTSRKEAATKRSGYERDAISTNIYANPVARLAMDRARDSGVVATYGYVQHNGSFHEFPPAFQSPRR